MSEIVSLGSPPRACVRATEVGSVASVKTHNDDTASIEQVTSGQLSPVLMIGDLFDDLNLQVDLSEWMQLTERAHAARPSPCDDPELCTALLSLLKQQQKKSQTQTREEDGTPMMMQTGCRKPAERSIELCCAAIAKMVDASRSVEESRTGNGRTSLSQAKAATVGGVELLKHGAIDAVLQAMQLFESCAPLQRVAALAVFVWVRAPVHQLP